METIQYRGRDPNIIGRMVSLEKMRRARLREKRGWGRRTFKDRYAFEYLLTQWEMLYWN